MKPTQSRANDVESCTEVKNVREFWNKFGVEKPTTMSQTDKFVCQRNPWSWRDSQGFFVFAFSGQNLPHSVTLGLTLGVIQILCTLNINVW